MEYITLNVPSYPFFIYSGDALYRPGDFHRKRAGIDCFDLLFVEYGGLYMRVENNNYHIKKNDMLIMPPGKAHEAYQVCDEKTYFHWLHFNTAEPYQISDTFKSELKTPRKMAFNKNYTETLVLPVFQSISDVNAAIVIRILSELESLRINKYLQGSMISKETEQNPPLREQERFLNLLSQLIIADESSGSREIAFMLMQYLQANYSLNISLRDMAKVANCHPTHVIRCFNRKYNITPVKALVNIRLQQAKELLQSTNLSCDEISYRVGFSSPSYFSKLFKEHNGITPQGYRKTQR